MFLAIAVLTMGAAGAPQAACVAAARDIAAGEQISADLLVPVDCRAQSRGMRWARFDRMSGSLTAREALPAGTYLGRLSTAAAPLLPKGARVTLRASSGPAIVEREVTTLQPARAGQRVFVRDAEGNVFAAALAVSNTAPAIR
jgi:flagella basal body P-ring formation protein FlgA